MYSIVMHNRNVNNQNRPATLPAYALDFSLSYFLSFSPFFFFYIFFLTFFFYRHITLEINNLHRTNVNLRHQVTVLQRENTELRAELACYRNNLNAVRRLVSSK